LDKKSKAVPLKACYTINSELIEEKSKNSLKTNIILDFSLVFTRVPEIFIHVLERKTHVIE
jgi:hypothetical protein